jgi:hypothetical protein
MRDDIIRMARVAGFKPHNNPDLYDCMVASEEAIERLAALVRADERNKLAQWMMAQGYATGHGETMEGLLEELEREVGFKRAELWIKRINEAVLAEREACAKVCDDMAMRSYKDIRAAALESAAENIRARGNT